MVITFLKGERRISPLIVGTANAANALSTPGELSTDRLDQPQLHGISLAGGTLVHARAISDEVDEDGENRQDDEEKDPHSLEEPLVSRLRKISAMTENSTIR